MRDKKQQFELDLKQQTGSKLGKEYIKAVYCHLAYLTFCKVLHEKFWLESRLQGGKKKIAGRNDHLRDADDTTLTTERKRN